MLDREATSVPKWPFLLGDLLLLGLAGWVGWEWHPVEDWHLLVVTACIVTGAVLAVLPFVLEHRARLRLAEVRGLHSVSEQMNHLRTFTNQISFATAQWQVAREHGDKTVSSATQLVDRMTAEAKAFTDFLKARDENEKAQLRLEIEKSRKTEVEWLQIVVRILDHVFALHQAAIQSGQPRLVDQLSRFQHACRDAVRRAGLVAFEPTAEESYNPQLHQLPDGHAKPSGESVVQRTLAPGFNFQGRVLRPALVTVVNNGSVKSPEAVEEPAGRAS